jgi:hypothetical protein
VEAEQHRDDPIGVPASATEVEFLAELQDLIGNATD